MGRSAQPAGMGEVSCFVEAASDLAKIGLGVDVLTIQRVTDPEGYIIALGKKRTAEVKRDKVQELAHAESCGTSSTARYGTIAS